jgi:hypothetical protein
MATGVELGVGYIETFAGNGKARSTGDGKVAVKAGIPLPHHVALDKEERYLYFAESGSDRVRRVDLQAGTLHNFSGIGETCYSGDDGPCAEAGLYLPLDVTLAAIASVESIVKPASLRPSSGPGSTILMATVRLLR